MNLQEALDEEIEFATVTAPLAPDNVTSYLHLYQCKYDDKGNPWPDGQPAGITYALFVDGGGPQVLASSQMFIVQTDPALAVLVWPSWGAWLPPGKHLGDYGVDEVSKLPKELLRDYLNFSAEDPSGVYLERTFVSEPTADGKPHWIRHRGPMGGAQMRPLYVYDRFRKWAQQVALDKVGKDYFGLKPNEIEYHQRRACAQALEMRLSAFSRGAIESRRKDERN